MPIMTIGSQVFVPCIYNTDTPDHTLTTRQGTIEYTIETVKYSRDMYNALRAVRGVHADPQLQIASAQV